MELLNCLNCKIKPVLVKGPSYLPDFEYRCEPCEIGTHGYGNICSRWSENEARQGWNKMIQEAARIKERPFIPQQTKAKT